MVQVQAIRLHAAELREDMSRSRAWDLEAPAWGWASGKAVRVWETTASEAGSISS